MTVKATKRTYAIAMILMSGMTPWGRQIMPGLCLVPGATRSWGYQPARWIACCGHVLTPAAMDVWIAEGLAEELPPGEGQYRQVGPGPKLEAWISRAFEGLKVQHWGQSA